MSLNLENRIEAGQFEQYCFMVKTLTKFEVECSQDSDGELQVKYNYGNGHFKICRPLESDKTKKWRSARPKNQTKPEFFGFKQLPEKGELVVITGGEKDVMTFDGYFGIPAITLQNESAIMPSDLISLLKSRFRNVAICYDNDDTGKKFSKKWSEKYNLARIELPDDLVGKDIYDFVSSGRTKDELQGLIDLAIKTQQENKTSFTSKEILESSKSLDFIIEDFLPKSNLMGLIGGSDTGKSLLLLQFSICYILNKPFLGAQVNGGKKVIFFSFEDEINSLKKRLSKLLHGFTQTEKEIVGDRLIFELDPEGFEDKAANLIEANTDTGIIIIDPLTEILNGADMSNPSSVREQMHKLNKISLRHDLTVIFINHVTKSAEESGKLNKSNSIGSQAIESKSRVMLEMKKRLKGIGSPLIELGIVKGNDIDEKFKSSGGSICLKFNSETFWFEKIVGAGPSIPQTPKINWDSIFGENKKMKAKDIIQRLRKDYDFDEKKSRNIISEDLEAFRVQHGIYGRPTQQ